VIGGANTFGHFARKLEAERIEAASVVTTILTDPERYLDAQLPPAWRTIGMVELLCDAARTELVRWPRRSLHLAQLAAAIADALPESYPRLLRAQAAADGWKAISNAHRFASRHDAALTALDIAGARISDEPALAYDRAILALARAITLREMDRMDEALRVLEGARETFSDYEDVQQVAQCDLVTGMIHHRLGRLADARQAYMRVIPSARAAGDLHTVAAAYNNLGRAAADAGDMNASVDALQQARAIFRELDMPTETSRATWSIGAAQLAASRFESAIAILGEVRREFQKLGMPEEAGLAGVDLIEALLATNARAAARELAGEIVDELRRAALNERALHALSYLRETADVATPSAARHVGTYLRRLKDEPKLLFIEPDPER